MSIGNTLSLKDWGSGPSMNFASLQPTAVQRPNAPGGINQIEMPSWLKTNPDENLNELLQSYAGVGVAFDPTGQVNARNAAIGYNTSAGNQMANNAASEYAQRAAQSGGSTLGAGAVKAQAMMPVLQQNAALRTDAADVAAKSHQAAASLASQIASTIGNLRTSYLQTLTGYAQGQQDLQMNRYKIDQDVANQQQQQQLEYAKLQTQQQLGAASSAFDYAQLGQQDQLGLAQLNQQGQLGLAQLNQQGSQNAAENAYKQMALQQQSRLSEAQLQADLYKTNLSAKQTNAEQARLAAATAINIPRPTGNYVTDNSGRVTSGMDYYKQLQAWNDSQNNSRLSLQSMY